MKTYRKVRPVTRQMFREKPLVWRMSPAVMDEHVSMFFLFLFFSGEVWGKRNVAVTAADGQRAGRKCTTLMMNHDVFHLFYTHVTAQKTANAPHSRSDLFTFLGQPIRGVGGASSCFRFSYLCESRGATPSFSFFFLLQASIFGLSSFLILNSFRFPSNNSCNSKNVSVIWIR